MIFRNKRSEMEIVFEILSAAKKKIKKTPLLYKSNLCYDQFTVYMDYLEENKLLSRIDDENLSQVYYITEKGETYLELVEKLMNIMEQ